MASRKDKKSGRLLGHFFGEDKSEAPDIQFANPPVADEELAKQGGQAIQDEQAKHGELAMQDGQAKQVEQAKHGKLAKQVKLAKPASKRTFVIDDGLWLEAEDLIAMQGKTQVEFVNGLLRAAVDANAEKLRKYRELRES
jgi:hypothetical protein